MKIRSGNKEFKISDAVEEFYPLLTADSLRKSRGIVFKSALKVEERLLLFEYLPGESGCRGNVHDDMSVAPHEDSAVIGWIAEKGPITLLCKITTENFDGGFKEPYKSRMTACLGSVAAFLSKVVSLAMSASDSVDAEDKNGLLCLEIDWATNKFLKESRLVEEPFSCLNDLARIRGTSKGND